MVTITVTNEEFIQILVALRDRADMARESAAENRESTHWPVVEALCESARQACLNHA